MPTKWFAARRSLFVAQRNQKPANVREPSNTGIVASLCGLLTLTGSDFIGARTASAGPDRAYLPGGKGESDARRGIQRMHEQLSHDDHNTPWQVCHGLLRSRIGSQGQRGSAT
jgi:hypothetical protein